MLTGIGVEAERMTIFDGLRSAQEGNGHLFPCCVLRLVVEIASGREGCRFCCKVMCGVGRLQVLFERLVAGEAGVSCPLLWRCYIAFEAGRSRPQVYCASLIA